MKKRISSIWRKIKQIDGSVELFLIAFGGGIVANCLTGLKGYRALDEETLQRGASLLVIVISLAIIPEAYSYGLRSSWTHWKSRVGRVLFWLTFGLAIRAGMVAGVAILLGLHSPWQVAGGLLATDPAGVAISLSFQEPVHFAPLFWQMSIESQLNDAGGLVVYEIAKGKDFGTAGIEVLYSILTGFLLAVVQILLRQGRRLRKNAKVEIALTIWLYLAFIAIIGIPYQLSIILISCIASFFADLAQALPILPENREEADEEDLKIHEYWEFLSAYALGFILALVVFLVPWVEFFTNSKALLAALALLGTVVASRFATEYGLRAVFWLLKKEWGVRYGLEAALVNSVAGCTILGIPMFVAIEQGVHGDYFAASTMMMAIGMSLIFIPFTVKTIDRGEKKHSGEPPEEL
jgi:hypothetical protein